MEDMSESTQPAADTDSSNESVANEQPNSPASANTAAPAAANADTSAAANADSTSRPRERRAAPSSAPSSEPSAMSLMFLMACILFLAAWFVGPRLVEEYQYASAKGKLRAEYELSLIHISEPTRPY